MSRFVLRRTNAAVLDTLQAGDLLTHDLGGTIVSQDERNVLVEVPLVAPELLRERLPGYVVVPEATIRLDDPPTGD